MIDRIEELENNVFILQQANDILTATLHDLVNHINLMTNHYNILYGTAPPKLILDTIYLDGLDDDDDD